jgi:hypothetical protein
MPYGSQDCLLGDLFSEARIAVLYQQSAFASDLILLDHLIRAPWILFCGASDIGNLAGGPLNPERQAEGIKLGPVM